MITPGKIHVERAIEAIAVAGCLFLLILSRQATPVSFEREFGNKELYVELEDPYYFPAGLYSSLTKDPIPTLDTIYERPLYRHLLYNAFRPNCFLVEIGTYPLPLAGVAAKRWAPTYYNKARIGETNLVEAITESINFKEPWSISMFFGHLVFFKSKAGSLDGHANIGLLCSYGYYHIKDNDLFPDNWEEFEAKIKVDKKGSQRQYGNSYRIGSRIHGNPDIKNEFYVGLNRDRTDFNEHGFSFIKNTNMQVRYDMSFKPLQPLSLMMEAGKKFPFRTKKNAYEAGLSLGATWNINSAYSGQLAYGFKRNSLTPVIRPMLSF
ncbi:MAG: hypothetical protein WBM07_00865 [Chitinivibrionales bacterium]